ncbi:MAG: PAS domain-containing protein, partial [Gammaproteobacteria bacterium]|nr:PAS domain-containing protein [Gammaproteobacteria bacterium]
MDNTSIQCINRFNELAPDDVFLSVVQHSHDAVVISDASCVVLFWNNAAVKMFGYEPDEALGREFHDLICPEHLREQANRSLHRFIESAGGEKMGMVGKTVT